MAIFRSCDEPPGLKKVTFTILFLFALISLAGAVTKKAIIDWSPNGEPFRDPMPDHAALVELHLRDRIVFVCDSNVPAVIYRVSEESFDECKYDLSAEWIGKCTAGTKYISITLRSNSAFAVQPAYSANATYFFTSFSSGTHAGMYEKSGALCLMGVRMILEMRRSSKRVPLLTRSFTSEFDEIQVPVQRVTYGGRPSTRRPRVETSTTSARKRNIIVHNPHETSDESDFWSGWPWGGQNSYKVRQAEKILPTFADMQNLEWDPWSSEYFSYSPARNPSMSIFLISLTLFYIT